MRLEEPETYEEAAGALARAAAEGSRVRFRGGGTKLGWGNVDAEPDVEISTARLGRIQEHNAADLTAVLQAGARLDEAQGAFRQAGQMLALDPADGNKDGFATIGGVVATGDSGPLRHRYGAPRDLLLGMTVALSDGTIARSGGKVIKNVAGYDLAKLFAGSFGTLGMILEVAIRLYPRASRTRTCIGRTDDPEVLQRSALAVVSAPLELEALDVGWDDGAGSVLARAGGVAPDERIDAAAEIMRGAGCRVTSVEGDPETRAWATQRSRQRSEPGGVMVRVSALPGDLAAVTGSVMDAGGALVGRAGGLLWCTLPPGEPGDLAEAVEKLRAMVAPSPCAVLDAPPEVRQRLDVWGVADGSELELMRRVKARFDPAGVCNPGIFVGGI